MSNYTATHLVSSIILYPAGYRIRPSTIWPITNVNTSIELYEARESSHVSVNMEDKSCSNVLNSFMIIGTCCIHSSTSLLIIVPTVLILHKKEQAREGKMTEREGWG